MAFNWRKFPWTNLHDLNLDWIIQTVKTLEDNLAAAVSTFQEMINKAISSTLTGSGDLTINKTGDVNITGNRVIMTGNGGHTQMIGGAFISDTSEQLTLHNPNSSTNMTANYNNGVLTLTNNQQLANGVAVYPINTPADGGGDNSDFAANVGYVKDAVAAVNGKLDTEISNRTSGDAALQSRIDNVIIPRLNKIPTKTSDLINDSGFGTYSKPAGGIPESDLTFDVRTKLNAREKNIITIETENVDPLNPYKSSKTLTEIKNDFTHNIEQFVFYDNISYKLEKIITDNGAEKAVFYSTSRLVNNVLTYYTCEIYEGNFGYSTADFHTYTYTVSGGGAVESVNGQTGVVVLDADAVGAQRTLIAGSGISIVSSENGDIIQSDAAGGSGTVSFVDVAGGAPIAEFTLNQMQDCEINVNDLNASLSTEVNNIKASLSTNYRTAAAQDAIDNTKITDAPVDGKEYARKNGSWSEVTGAVESVNGKTGVVTLNATEIPSTKLSPADTISFLIDGAFDEGLVELKRNGASASANDFISAINSGSTVTVGLNDQGNPKVTFDDRPVKYKITGDTLSLCFIAEAGHTYTPAIYVLSGTTSGATVSTLVEHNFTDSFYQENYVSANDLPVQAPLSVEEYLEKLESNVDALQPKSITDTGSYFTTDTVEGALQEIGAGLAGAYSKPSRGIPKTDLAEAVQTSLGRADTALQEHQSLAAYRTAAAQDIIDNGKQDKITSTNKLAYSLISGTPTIPTVPTNVSAFTNDAGYLTLATLPKYEGETQ